MLTFTSLTLLVSLEVVMKLTYSYQAKNFFFPKEERQHLFFLFLCFYFVWYGTVYKLFCMNMYTCRTQNLNSSVFIFISNHFTFYLLFKIFLTFYLLLFLSLFAYLLNIWKPKEVREQLERIGFLPQLYESECHLVTSAFTAWDISSILYLILCVFEIRSLIESEMHQFDWVVSSRVPSASASFSSMLGLRIHGPTPKLLHGCWESELTSSYLCSKHFTQCITSPFPLSFLQSHQKLHTTHTCSYKAIQLDLLE